MCGLCRIVALSCQFFGSSCSLVACVVALFGRLRL